MVIVGAGAAARADGAAVLGARGAHRAAPPWTARTRAGTPSTCCTRRPRASPASTSASCRTTGGLDVAGMLAAAGKGKLDVLYLLGADEIELPRGRQRVRHLPGQPRRPRRASRRRHPAGRRLHREERDLRQHRGPRADDRARRVPAGRGQGGLGDRSRAVGASRAHAALRHARRRCAPPCTRRRRSSRASTRVEPAPRDGVDALAKTTRPHRRRSRSPRRSATSI